MCGLEDGFSASFVVLRKPRFDVEYNWACFLLVTELKPAGGWETRNDPPWTGPSKSH